MRKCWGSGLAGQPVVIAATSALRADSPLAFSAVTAYACEEQAANPPIVADVPVTVARTVPPSYTR